VLLELSSSLFLLPPLPLEVLALLPGTVPAAVGSGRQYDRMTDDDHDDDMVTVLSVDEAEQPSQTNDRDPVTRTRGPLPLTRARVNFS
jgi:hypothetical protein